MNKTSAQPTLVVPTFRSAHGPRVRHRQASSVADACRCRDRGPQPTGSREADRSRHDRRSTRRSCNDPARSGAGVRQPCCGARDSPTGGAVEVLRRSRESSVCRSGGCRGPRRGAEQRGGDAAASLRPAWLSDVVVRRSDRLASRSGVVAPRAARALDAVEPARPGGSRRQQGRLGAESASVARPASHRRMR